MNRLRAGEWVALGGALGLIASLFADWFSGPGRATATGWSALGWAALALVVAATLLTVALWLLFAAGAGDVWNLVPGVIAPVLTPACLLVLVVVTLLKPGDATAIEPAAWAGLACAALMTGGILASLHNERRTGPGRVFQPPPARPAPPA